ncbi:MAG: MMPL family transporter, partial [Pseudomonadota bacterium]|nr:MMPL family transporter [Pseudomonadota bacterium]
CAAKYRPASGASGKTLLVVRAASPRSAGAGRLGNPAAWIEKTIAEVTKRHPGIRATAPGPLQLGQELTPALMHDLLWGDAITIPVAVGVMCWALGSTLAFVWFPVLTIAVAMSASISLQAALWPSAKAVAPVSLNIVMVLAIALSVDYSLFLLSRWIEEVRAGHSAERSLVVALHTAGRTAVVSGVTLAVAFSGLWLFPLDLVQTIGHAAISTAIAAVFTNVALVPALIVLLADRLFARLRQNSAVRELSKSDQESIWYSIGNRVTTPRIAGVIVVAILLLSVVCIRPTIAFEKCGGLTQCIGPFGTDYQNAYQRVAKDYGAFYGWPFVATMTMPRASAAKLFNLRLISPAFLCI